MIYTISDIKERIKNLRINLHYYFLSFLLFLIYFVSVTGAFYAVYLSAAAISLSIEKYVSDYSLLIGWFIGLIIGGILFMGLKRLHPYLERFGNHIKIYKRFPYTEKYGKDYREPRPEDFGITKSEFQEYNRRFQFAYIKLIFTWGLLFVGCIEEIYLKMKGIVGIVYMGSVITIALLLNFLFDYLNKRISKKHRFYEKINKYQEIQFIYFKIRNENRKD
jgi:hypothetical protein